MTIRSRFLLSILAVIVAGTVAVAIVLHGRLRVGMGEDAAVRGALVAGGAAAVVALGLATLLARSVSRPLVELRDVARAIAAGDLSRRPAPAPSGEIGQLSDAMGAMGHQLEARRRAQQEEQALLGSIVESLDEGVVAVDRRMHVVRMNGAARTLLDLHGPTPFPVEQLPHVRELRAAMDEALRGTVAEPREMQIAGRTLVVAARPLPAHGVVIAVSDLTRARRLESVRRDFVANVSHELRTPLTVIGGFAETLADGAVNEDDRTHFARLIAQNAHRMQRIVDELLDLSRIESGGWIPRPGNVDVAEVARDVIAANASAAARHAIALDAHIPPDVPTVYADRTALRQILGNLVENAVRHTTTGSITIFASREADGWTTVGVRDSGSGIAAEHLPRIFERFYRADAARSRESGGTGLGLAIVKHLVEAHGGRVGAESDLGRGTTIAASFPPAPTDATAV